MVNSKKVYLLLALVLHQSYAATLQNTFIAFIGGFNAPGNIAVTPNGLYAYVADTGSNSVLVIDTDSSSSTFNTLIAAPNLSGVFNNPAGIAITPNSLYAYVADAGSNSVLVIDTNPSSLTFNSLITVPSLSGAFNAPNSIAITPDGLYAYVTNGGNNSVNVIDLTTYAILTTPNLNGILNSPFAIAITPSGQYAYITNTGNAAIVVIGTDPSNLTTYNSVVPAPGLVSVNAEPEGFAITANGLFAYVSDGAGADVTLIDINPASPTFNTVLSAPNLEFAFNAPNGVVTAADGNYAYVTNFLGSSGAISCVTVIDTNPLSPTYNSTLTTPALNLPATFTLRFVALAITPNARFVYAVDTYNNTVDVIATGIIDAPRNVSGCTIKNIFLLQVNLINRLSWSAPILGNAPVAYQIYRDAGLTDLVATVPATVLQYDDYASTSNTYYIVSVDCNENSSAPAIITVANFCS